MEDRFEMGQSFFMENRQCGMRWLFDYFSRFVNCFFFFFFWLLFFKSTLKDHLMQGNLLKATSLNEKQINLEKEKYGNMSLYSQYFSMFTTHTFTS